MTTHTQIRELRDSHAKDATYNRGLGELFLADMQDCFVADLDKILSGMPADSQEGDRADLVRKLTHRIENHTWAAFDRALLRECLDMLAAAPQPSSIATTANPVEMSPEFTDTARSALCWVLWHHQGASSEVGQAMRFALGMGATDRMSDVRVAEAKRWEAFLKESP